MPGKAPQFKLRAELREPLRVYGNSGLPGGWWMWCLFGLALGLCAWLASRHLLRQQLNVQLAESKSTLEALQAMQGLLLLDEQGSIELVRGLEHSDGLVARSAFQALDQSISSWRGLNAGERKHRWRQVAVRLNEIPSSAPSEHLILAGSLASRVYADCLAANDPQLQSTMQLCQEIICKAGKSSNSAHAGSNLSDFAAIDQQIALAAPPPPLTTDETAVTNGVGEAGPLSDAVRNTESTQLSATASLSDRSDLKSDDAQSLTDNEPSQASMHLVSSPVRPLKDSIANASSSWRMSLSDAGLNQATSIAQSMLLSTPATVDDQQAADAALAGQQPTLDNEAHEEVLHGIESLPIAELVRLLASVQPRVAQAAVLALRRKGMTDDRLELASELATGTIEQRQRLVNSVASRGDLDPRPWLLWMAQDGQPEVRKQSIALLSSMLDVNVQRQLRMLLNREQDESVANSIRRALFATGQTTLPILR